MALSQTTAAPTPRRAPAPLDAGSPGFDLFLPRGAGAIAFQRRVFEEAQDDRNPLLERVKFLAILGANLTGLARRARLAGAVRQLREEAEAYFAQRLSPELAAHGIDAPRAVALSDLTLVRLWTISRLGRPDLHDPPLLPRHDPGCRAGALFDAVRARDVLLHHPFDSFGPVMDLVRAAAADPAVTAIALTLYRTDEASPIGDALLEALRRGKEVQAVVELKARHDEENNARWGAALRQAGARVTYGIVGLKVHAKLAAIDRREGGTIRRYVHISSGNYHAATSQCYTDLALLTCDAGAAADVGELFAFLGGRPGVPAFGTLLVAPFGLRRRVRALIDREIEWARQGAPGHIVLKMNALTDREVILHLYRASQAGVRVDLVVRGICCLRPGVPGLSDRIHVRSIVGRFLEHSRAWYFRNGGNDEAYIGSADLRSRNLDRRVEVMVRLDEPLTRRIRTEVLETYLADTRHARVLCGDGRYARVRPCADQPAVSSHQTLMAPHLRGAS